MLGEQSAMQSQWSMNKGWMVGKLMLGQLWMDSVDGG